MKVNQFTITSIEEWTTKKVEKKPKSQLVLAFGNRHFLESEEIYPHLRKLFPIANIVLSSTAGQIQGPKYIQDGLVITAVEFDYSHIEAVSVRAEDFNDSFELGKSLYSKLPSQDLKHIFVLSDGQAINGSDLVRGLNEVLPKGVALTGGLAGDDARFEKL